MINLFEYKNTEGFDEKYFSHLDDFLDDIWSKREKSNYYYTEEENRVEKQRFIQFFYKNKTIKSNKYVGVIHYEKETINLLPKIFYTGKKTSEQEVKTINKHILWWLSYCRKLKFPNYLSGLSNEKADFFEILIYLFSKYTRELLNSSIFQKYTEVHNELSFVKGAINFNKYISNNLSKGRNHKISCEYDSFEMDNEFNRAIKYVSKLLLSTTKETQSKRFLNDILFILDDVKDITVSVEQLKRMRFNPMFSDFETVRDYCVLFLENSISFNYKNSLQLFAFLLPMEYVFEDFIFGFIAKEISEIKAEAQVNSKHLDEEKNFKLKPDLYLNFKNNDFIADTKYKIIYSNENDPKNGVSQNDLYQMLAYAVRFKIDKIVLYYPNTYKNDIQKESALTLNDELAGNKKIEIKIHQLPIINEVLFDTININKTIKELFEITRLNLIDTIKKTLVNTQNQSL